MSVGIRSNLDLPRHSLVVAALALIPPPVAFVLLLLHPRADVVFGSHTIHFVIVSLVAGAALLLALTVAAVVRTIPDARTFFLAMGFVSMAGIFLAHGLGTAPFLVDVGGTAATMEGMPMGTAPASGPGDGDYGYGTTNDSDGYGYAPQQAYGTSTTSSGSSTIEADRLAAVGLSARLSLVVSALFFALAGVRLRPRLSAWLVRHVTLLMCVGLGVIALYIVVALDWPAVLLRIPTSSNLLGWGLGAVAALAFAFAGWRFLQAYRLSYLPLQGTMALSIAWLIEAQWFMISGPAWHLSWWEYHVVMLAGFLAPVLGLLWQYRLTGDLSAVVAGLFLREMVTGIRSGDPEALGALGVAVAAKDGETSAHVDRVSLLAVAIGERFGLPNDQLEILRWAGRLHDLGKIGVPDSILLKPGPLTEEEFRAMRLHSVRGWQVARRSGALAPAAAAIRGHHERWDGRGYPDGLQGEAIPFLARIISVADVWDAVTAARPYRPAMSRDQAAEIIRRETGAAFDPRCVDQLFAVLGLPSVEPAGRPSTRAGKDQSLDATGRS
jgi:HD-GYP domain-containing protein (c-di-GMP phosphodiesterase class II)